MEFVRNAQVLPNASDVPHTARAKKLVVLSAGGFGSPAILERSGIGKKDVLERNGIKQVVDLPMVGENYNGTAAFRCMLIVTPRLTANASQTTTSCSSPFTPATAQRLSTAS